MTRPWFLAVATVSLWLTSGRLLAEEEAAILHCYKTSSFLAPRQEKGTRQYAPDRDFVPVHVAIDVTPDFQKRSIQGTTTLRFKANVQPARQLRLDAVDLRVQQVTSSETIQAYEVTDDSLVVTYTEPIPPGREVTLTVTYGAEPSQGLYFRTPEMGYKEGDTHLFTQGESITARHWYPCFDAPSDMLTSEVTCRVPEGMTVISNGRLVSETKDPDSGLKVVRWSQEQPHANYLITLVAGYFEKVEDRLREIPLAFFTPRSEIAHATNSFQGTKEMVEFFEKETGVPYPWPKYYQVCVNDFVAGGMENTSATTLTDGTLFEAAAENIDTSEGLVAHELAHQWFGDLLTCKDWSHTWLNEGFATYYEALWQGNHHGRDALKYEMFNTARMITSIGGTPQPIVRRTFDDPDQMFGHLSYQKGGWVLHMLRSELGEELYRKCIHTWLERYRHRNVVTEDLRRIIEELSGRSFDQFFDQWLYHAHHPELEVNYSWDELARLARINVRQVQKLDTNVLVFNVPLTVRFKGKFGTKDQTLQVSKKEEDFSVALESAPQLVRVDPEGVLLAKINFTPSRAMLDLQLDDKDDVIGRLLAVEQLGKRKDDQAIAKLKQTLNQDGFYGVRMEASRALRGLHSDEALAVLLESTAQPDARVRRQVIDDVGGFYSEKAYALQWERLGQEKNPEIKATIVRDLGGYPQTNLLAKFIELLDAQSFRDRIADAAISGLRSQDDPAAIKPLMNALAAREKEFTSVVFAHGLSALAYLGRNQEQKDDIREFLLKYVNSQRRAVKFASLSGLGTLGDTKAIAVLEKFATAAKQDRERTTAEAALTSLRAARRPVDDFKNLRQEVLDLQKADREVRKELEDLKKRIKEGASRPSAPATPAAEGPEESKAKGKVKSKPPEAPLRSPKAG